MNGPAALAAIWGPLLLGVLAFGMRELVRPTAAAQPAPGRATALPMFRNGAAPTKATEYTLDLERSTIRFLLRTGDSECRYDCPLAQGALVLSAKDAECQLELTLDLAALRAADPGNDPAGPAVLRELLGVHRAGDIRFRGDLVSRASAPIAVLQLLTWSGPLRFGSTVVRQPLQLWQTAIPGQPIRLQGHGTVTTAAYGLRRDGWLGIFPQEHVVTLGLDLAWKRVAAR
ncbi:MAG: hypothetical protein RL398_593 [Planctomycetota bacterium]